MNLSKYKGKAVAGTASVNWEYVIKSEKVVHHYSQPRTSAEPEFSELVGLEIISRFGCSTVAPINLTYTIQG